jgi:cytochrome c peroxidase
LLEDKDKWSNEYFYTHADGNKRLDFQHSLALIVTQPNGIPPARALYVLRTWKEKEAKGVINRNKNLQFIYTLAIGVVLLLSSSRAFATNDENHIQEIMAGVNGNSKIQFIVIKQEGGGNLWGPQAGETQSRVMLVFFDAAGRETGKFKFPHDVPLDANTQLIATQDFANLTGAPAPDFIMPPLLSPISGKVCFTNNPLNSNAFPRTDCVSYGSFPAAQTGTDDGGCNGVVTAGPPTAALPIMNTVSLKRTSTACGSVPNSDFALNTTPTPTNDAGKTLTIPVATQVAQGENLFNGETFQGNGRTCATCHVATLNFALPPSNIKSRFSTLSAMFDPLFIGETNPSSFDSGFDFNLNTLVLTQTVSSGAPCSGTLQGIITSGSGATLAKAKVLTQVSPTTYLVYGGMNPALSGTVSDSSSCSGTVMSITAGSLGAIPGSSVLGLEDPKRMRTSADTANFPNGRGLILENIDGFPPTAPVFRKSPHLLNLNRRFPPFGLSGSVGDLRSFATGAVTQHFPRTLARNSGGSNPDFRLPTPDEQAAMETFMRAQEFPTGTDPNKFDLNRFVITAAQQRGFAAFLSKCSFCHGATVLTSSSTFNTGVVSQTINSPGMDNLPCEPAVPCGTREFSVRQLFNVANLGPFFHDNSAATLKDVIAFYNSSFFNTSPGATFVGGINTTLIGPTAADDIVAFLEGISFSPFTPTFGRVGTSVTITDPTFAGATAVSFNGVAAAFTEGPPGTITTTVPAGATTGPITITTPGSGPLITTTRFTVTPAVTSFAPASGGSGTSVTITGTNFTGATAVRFNGAPATFTVSNSGTVTTTVPAGATTGPITVITLDGTATSAASFTVIPAPFSLGATPSSQTVSAGASTSYTVTISRTAGFTDNLTFSVAGLPAATTATFSPNPTTGNSSTMTVTTTSRAQLTPGPALWAPPANFSVRAWPLWAICLLVMVLLACLDRARRHIPRWVFATGAFAVLLCIGCGGGSPPPPPPPPPHGTPAGTFTITVTATSSNAGVPPVSMPVTLVVQ